MLFVIVLLIAITEVFCNGVAILSNNDQIITSSTLLWIPKGNLTYAVAGAVEKNGKCYKL